MVSKKNVYVGTSGFSYPQWKGGFYPAGTKAQEMLGLYAGHFRSVEINNTFYRMPRRSVLENWVSQVPDDFRFVIKASRRITHQNRLKNTESNIEYLFKQLEGLGEKLGPVFFQLPRNLKKDVPRLAGFLQGLPAEASTVFEFANPSWEDPEVFDLLRSHGAAVCVADREKEAPDPEGVLPVTAPFGYVRLRREQYTDEELGKWARRISGAHDRAFVFFMHEDEGEAPALALRFMDALG